MSGRKQDCVKLYIDKTKVVGQHSKNVAKKPKDLSQEEKQKILK